LSRHGAATDTMSSTVRLQTDAFSGGQIKSKIWAAEKLEWCVKHHELGSLNMYILGGWYALLFLLLKIRNNIKIDECRSYDIDRSACTTANIINETWVADSWHFHAEPKDINDITYNNPKVNCVINTSTEHMGYNTWWDNIPAGTICLLQSNDLNIDEHINLVYSTEQLMLKYPMSELFYEGQQYMDGYNRFMIIGRK
jgi:hypothetical protein